MSQRHDLLFRALVEDATRAGILIRDMVSLAGQEWLRQGRTEGLTKGRGEGKLELFRVLLEARFGASPAVLDSYPSRVPAERLDMLTRRAATAEGLDDLFTGELRH